MTTLYDLMPAVYRDRDEQLGGPLRELLEIIEEQLGILRESIDQSYDDEFIETCADWVVPYIGDLIGYRPLRGVVPTIASPRAEVANTIAYRRRKGTAAMLEQLAFDVTGWKAAAVEFFERLAISQYMNHPRPGRGGTLELRSPDRLAWTDTAFDSAAHTAEVRRISTGAGRYNIPNVGLFLWRVSAVELTRSPLAPDAGSDRRFRFNPLGTDQPLFGKAATEDEIIHLAEPLDVPLPLTRRWLRAHLDVYYGLGRSLLVDLLGAATPPDVRICDLSDVTGGWAHEPAPGSGVVAVDPVLGRVCFPDPVTAPVTAVATHHYGTALEIGGGGYGRPAPAGPPPVATVDSGGDVQAALATVVGGGTVEIADNWRYDQTPSVSADDDSTVLLRSADRRRPLLAASGPVQLHPGRRAVIVLDGLMICGGPLVLEPQPDIEVRHLVLRHCTLVPGLTRTSDNKAVTPAAASLVVRHPYAQVVIERCVLGPIVAVDGATVSLRDSVLDASAATGIAYAGDDGDGLTAGAALTLDESTVVGRVHASRLDISNSLVLAEVPAGDTWPAGVWARRRQVGCVRYSYLPPGSRAPARYHCQPTAPAIVAHFTSLRFGDPGYAQLRPSTPVEIRAGADDESEMGAGHHLFAPQREANLRLRLDEYLRFGLEAGIFYAT